MFFDNLKNTLTDNRLGFIGEETAFRSAILIPLVEKDGELHILFEVRALTMRKQPGDISFPGGRIDAADASPMAAALRETHEELGVDPEKVTIIGELSPYITSTTFVVYPFVGKFNYNDIIPFYNKAEVEEVFTIPLKWLLDYEPYLHLVDVEPTPSPNFPFEKIMNGDQYQWRARPMEEWFYDYGEYTVWGLTARILKHFIDLVKNNRKLGNSI